MCCPQWMRPSDAGLVVLLHPAQSESAQATTSSDAFWYLYQFTTVECSQPDEYVPVFCRGRRHSSRCFLRSVRDVHSVLCQEDLVTSSTLSASSLSSSSILPPSMPLNLRSFKSLPFSFSVSLPVSSVADVEMVLRFAAPVPRMIFLRAWCQPHK